MGAAKTQEDYHELAQSRGYKWLGPVVARSTLNTFWLCSNGHKWQATYANVRGGNGCHECGKLSSIENRRKKPKDYHELAELMGYKWLGPEVKSANHDYTFWLCPNGHKCKSTYGNLAKGCGCKECGINKTADARRKKPADYCALAELRGYKWLGPEVRISSDITSWECAEGHRWNARYTDIQSGGVCPTCWKIKMGNDKRKKPADYHAIAHSRGYKWLGTEVKSASQKTLWLCPAGHEWHGSYAALASGRGCPICGVERGADGRRLTRKDYHELARSKDLLWSGDEVSFNYEFTVWKCRKCGKEFSNNYANVKSNISGCPSCGFGYVNGVATSKPQRDLNEIIGGELNYKSGRYVIDIALPDYKIAVEYDCWHWHKDKIEKDERRIRTLILDGWKVLQIMTWENFPDKQRVFDCLRRLHRNESQWIQLKSKDWGGSNGVK